MNKFTYKLVTAASTAAILLGSFGPAAMGATSITVTGNGADSDNKIDFSASNTTSVKQSNTADIENNVTANASTGGNDANRNTGGDVSIDTGNATSNVEVSNTANQNVANVDGCCAQDVDVKISGNGDDSKNDAKVDVNHLTDVRQSNDADIENNVNADASTGRNDANRNTGGDVEISTGNAETTVAIANRANANWASVGNGGNGGSVDVEISGNGADSHNKVDLDLTSNVWAVQDNNADIENNVDADASTGNNDANRNTGGEVSVDTGDADTMVEVANLANFNGADLSSCDCEMDLGVKVAGNGADSKNDVKLDLDSVLAAEQTNDFDCDGHGGWWFTREWSNGGNCADVNADASTGWNDANSNTGDPEGDPSVMTGDATSDTTVNNTANSNVFGDVDFDFDMPEIHSSLDGFVFWLMAHLS